MSSSTFEVGLSGDGLLLDFPVKLQLPHSCTTFDVYKSVEVEIEIDQFLRAY